MRKISMREAVNEALHTAFNSDENVFTIGEDIGTYGGQLRCEIMTCWTTSEDPG
ncbi:MAG: hypothetical protein ACLR71_17975 [[Clostridium] scindens]